MKLLENLGNEWHNNLCPLLYTMHRQNVLNSRIEQLAESLGCVTEIRRLLYF